MVPAKALIKVPALSEVQQQVLGSILCSAIAHDERQHIAQQPQFPRGKVVVNLGHRLARTWLGEADRGRVTASGRPLRYQRWRSFTTVAGWPPTSRSTWSAHFCKAAAISGRNECR